MYRPPEVRPEKSNDLEVGIFICLTERDKDDKVVNNTKINFKDLYGVKGNLPDKDYETAFGL